MPRIKAHHDIVKRGGRVLVIDPRKTATAAQFEWWHHFPARLRLPAGCVALRHFVSAITQQTVPSLARQADGGSLAGNRSGGPVHPRRSQRMRAPYIDPDTVRALARDLARTRRAPC